MRHHQNKTRLGRVKRVRVALIRSLARSLILEEGITTTTAKAKAIRPFVERLITTSKANTVASRRSIATRLGGAPDAVKKLHDTIAPRFAKRAGGYIRITLLGQIGKQSTQSARIELVK